MNNKEIYDFMEQIFNIKLLPYQKMMLNRYYRIDNFPFVNHRRYERKMRYYIMLLQHVLFMKNNEKIAIASPKGIKEFNREQLFNHLQDEYWRK